MRTSSSAPVRSCVGCRTKRPQAELVRCAVTADGTPVISRTAPGRGAWLCAPGARKDQQATRCLEQAIKRRGFERAWKRPLGPAEHTVLSSALTIVFEAMTKNMEN